MNRLYQKKFSGQYVLRRLSTADMPLLLPFMARHGEFCAMGGGRQDAAGIEADMASLPPGKRPEDKHYCGFFRGEELAALLDLVEGYPTAETAYIGLFMVEKAYCRRGMGTALMEELLSLLNSAGFRRVRLGVLRENMPGRAFWAKLGFLPIAEKNIAGRTVDVMEKTFRCDTVREESRAGSRPFPRGEDHEG